MSSSACGLNASTTLLRYSATGRAPPPTAYRRRRILQRPQPQASEHKRRSCANPRSAPGSSPSWPDRAPRAPCSQASSRASAARRTQDRSPATRQARPAPAAGRDSAAGRPESTARPEPVRGRPSSARSKRGQAILAVSPLVDIVEHQDERSSGTPIPFISPSAASRCGPRSWRPAVAAAVRPSPTHGCGLEGWRTRPEPQSSCRSLPVWRKEHQRSVVLIEPDAWIRGLFRVVFAETAEELGF